MYHRTTDLQYGKKPQSGITDERA